MRIVLIVAKFDNEFANASISLKEYNQSQSKQKFDASLNSLYALSPMTNMVLTRISFIIDHYSHLEKSQVALWSRYSSPNFFGFI